MPVEASNCSSIQLLNGTTHDGVINPHSGSLLVSFIFCCFSESYLCGFAFVFPNDKNFSFHSYGYCEGHFSQYSNGGIVLFK